MLNRTLDRIGINRIGGTVIPLFEFTPFRRGGCKRHHFSVSPRGLLRINRSFLAA